MCGEFHVSLQRLRTLTGWVKAVEGGGSSPPPRFSPYCVGRTRRAKLNLACMESCKGIADLNLPVISLEETKVYDRV